MRLRAPHRRVLLDGGALALGWEEGCWKRSEWNEGAAGLRASACGTEGAGDERPSDLLPFRTVGISKMFSREWSLDNCFQ